MQRKNMLFIAFVGILSYGLLITRLGFYWDDWPFAWIAHFMGPKEFFPAFAPFRPFLAPIFYLTTSTLGTNPLNWQVFALILRVLISIASFWTFDLIWPRQKFSTLIVSLLLLVFPGYSQHFVALTHINQELIPLLFYIISFGFTALALREQKTKYLVLALLSQVLGIFPTEYFFTTEPLRFFFIFIISSSQASPPSWLRAKDAFVKWIPYLVIWALDAAWLYYYYRFGAYNSYGISVDDTQAATSLSLFSFIDALYKVCILIWVQIISLTGQSLIAPSTLGTISLVIVISLLSAFYFIRTKSANESNTPAVFISIGVAGILLGRIPSWAAGLPLVLQSTNDRFMVSMMIGGVLFVVGLLEFIKNERARIITASLLISLGIGQQFHNANIFRRDWEKQREFYWQLAWRVPALKKGTLILTHELPFQYETDFSTTAAVNWMYAPDYQAGDELPYALIYARTRLGGGKLPSLDPNTPAIFAFRTVTFKGNTSESITIYMPPTGCLRVLDPVYANAQVYERYSKFLTGSIPLSNPSLIESNGSDLILPEGIFGKEPEHGWCYYYENAELARQHEDWERVAELGAEAFKQTKSSDLQDGYELLPFIEAYAQTGALEKAQSISQQAMHAEIKPGTGVCQIWERTQTQSAEGSDANLFAAKMFKELSCSH